MVYSAYTPTSHGSYVIYFSVWASLLARARVRVRVDLDLAVSHGPRGGPKCVRVPE